MKRDNLKIKLLNTTRDIRRKFIQLRKGEQDFEEYTTKTFKPLTKPITELIQQQQQQQQQRQQQQQQQQYQQRSLVKIKKKLKFDENDDNNNDDYIDVVEDNNEGEDDDDEKEVSKNENLYDNNRYKPDHDDSLSISFLPEKETVSENTSAGTIDDDADDYTIEKTQNVTMDDLRSDLESFSPTLQRYFRKYNILPRTYLKKYWFEKNNIDKANGVKYSQSLDKWKLGNSTMNIKGDDLIINKTQYPGTKGLYELIFMLNPRNEVISEEDVDNYHKIIQSTNLYRRNNTPSGQINGNKSRKYKEFVKAVFSKPKSIENKSKTNPSSSSTFLTNIGKGLLLGVTNNKIDYRYFNDPNELVERLQLLKAAQMAGNNSVQIQNEIVAIEEELIEMQLIY